MDFCSMAFRSLETDHMWKDPETHHWTQACAWSSEKLMVPFLRCPTTAWPTDVAKQSKMGWLCLGSQRIQMSSASGRSRFRGPAWSGWPQASLTSAASTLAKSTLRTRCLQGQLSWGREQLPQCSSDHTAPPAGEWAANSACLPSSAAPP